jgi:hypothetical protein
MAAAIDARRCERKLSWKALAKAIWEQSRVLNERLNDHSISTATISRLGERSIDLTISSTSIRRGDLYFGSIQAGVVPNEIKGTTTFRIHADVTIFG